MHTKVKFFEENTKGRIVNRFSNDVSDLDQIVFTFLDMTDVSLITIYSYFIVLSKVYLDFVHSHNFMPLDPNFDLVLFLLPLQN